MAKNDKRNELTAKYDTRKSFYGKATYESTPKGSLVLYSYGSKVCEIFEGNYTLNHDIKSDLLYSHTTLRHIKEFLRQFLGIEHTTKAELMKH